MKTVAEISEILETVSGCGNIYFQPPESVKMVYPAIVFSRERIQNDFAGNGVYHQEWGYSVKVIDKNPESDIVKRVSALPMCRFDRHYKADGLNHDIFTVYF